MSNSKEYLNVEDIFYVEESRIKYESTEFPFSNETYKIIGACMEVHNILGRGFAEVVYKDALEHEFSLQAIPFEREKPFLISYKEIILKHTYRADFVIFDTIILEVKASKDALETEYKQTINYLAASKLPIALIVNFGEDKLKFKRIIL